MHETSQSQDKYKEKKWDLRKSIALFVSSTLENLKKKNLPEPINTPSRIVSLQAGSTNIIYLSKD